MCEEFGESTFGFSAPCCEAPGAGPQTRGPDLEMAGGGGSVGRSARRRSPAAVARSRTGLPESHMPLPPTAHPPLDPLVS